MRRMPQIGAEDLIKFLKKNGFIEVHKSGSHLTLRNEKSGATLTIPVHRGDIGRGLAVRILKDAGFTIDDYLKSRRLGAKVH
jgi:predicted RNA binding protein YcfA (HicA-like mRNA interferase family)